MNNLVLEVLIVVVLATHHGIYCYTVTDKVQSMYATGEQDHLVHLLNHGSRYKRSAALISNLFDGLRQGGDYVTGVMRRYQDIRDNIPRYISKLLIEPVNNIMPRHKNNRWVRLGNNRRLIIKRPRFDILVPGLRRLVTPLSFIPRVSSLIKTPVKIIENDFPSYKVNMKPEEIIRNKYIDPTILSSLRYSVPSTVERQLIPIIKRLENPRLNDNVSNIRQTVENINDILYKVLYENVLRNANNLPKIQDVTSIITENPMNIGNPGVIWDNTYSKPADNKLRYEQRRNWLLEQFSRITNPYVRGIIIRPDIIDTIISGLEKHTTFNTSDQRAEVDVIFFDSPMVYNNYIVNLESLNNNNQVPEFPENGNIILIVVKFDGDLRARLWIRNKQSTDVISQVHDVKVPENEVLIPPDTKTYQEQNPIDDFAYRIIGGKPATGSGPPIQSKGKRSLPHVDDNDEVEPTSDPEEDGNDENDSEENE